MTGFRALVLAQLATAAGLVLYWIVFFTVGLAPDPVPEGYFAYERAFPLPDALLASSLVCAAWLGARNDPRAGRISVASGGALVFLGVVDASFNFQSGVYESSPTDAALNLLVNAVSIAVGVACTLTRR